MSKIGNIRVSTEHQETASQQEIMRGYQVDRIFSEKISGEQGSPSNIRINPKPSPSISLPKAYTHIFRTLYVSPF